MKTLGLIFFALTLTLSLGAQAGQPGPGPHKYPEILVGRERGTDERIVRQKAVNQAIFEAIKILIGPNAAPQNQHPELKKLMERGDLARFGKLEGGDRAFTVRREGRNFEVEVRVRPDWPLLIKTLSELKIAVQERRGEGPGLPDTVLGIGRDKDPAKARQIAEKDVLRIAMLRLLETQGGQEAQKLRTLFEKTSAGEFTKPLAGQSEESQKIRDMTEIRVKKAVDWEKLSQYLTKEGFKVRSQQMAQNPGDRGVSSSSSSLSGGMTQGSTSADWGAVSEEEKNTILKYLDTLSFLVYYNEGSTANKNVLKSAVNQANMVLTRSGITVFDIDRVEKAKAAQLKIYEETKASGSVNYIQWIAQQLNADVYAQIDVLEGGSLQTAAAAESEAEAGAQTIAVLTTEIFDSSSGQLLGSFPVNILAVPGASAQNNITSLVLNVVEKAMTQAVIQAKEQMQKALVRGMRYDLVIQSTADSRLMSRFLDKLKAQVKQVKVLASSPSEYRYEVYYIGLLSDLESLLYKVTDTMTELQSLHLVVASGKSLTMDTGLE